MTTGPGTGRVSTSEVTRGLLAAINKPRPTTTPDIEVGQEARTKEWYVKSLHVPMNEGEGWAEWLRRVRDMAAMIVAELPAPSDGLHAELERSVMEQK